MSEQTENQQIERLHGDLVKEGVERLEKLKPLEKKALRQHILLSQMTNISWRLAENIDAIIIGTTDGAEKVHRSFLLGKKIKEDQGTYPYFIVSGGIGITVHEAKRLKVPGVNARVLAAQLREYEVPDEKILVEDKSKHAQEQAKFIGEIAKKYDLKSLLNVVGFWHSPRFYMTFTNQNPKLDLYTSVVARDTHRVSRAPFGLTGYPFDAPTQIAEVARIHQYSEKGIGPSDLEGLISYLRRFLANHPRRLGKIEKAYKELKPLWSETHDELSSGKFLRLR